MQEEENWTNLQKGLNIWLKANIFFKKNNVSESLILATKSMLKNDQENEFLLSELSPQENEIRIIEGGGLRFQKDITVDFLEVFDKKGQGSYVVENSPEMNMDIINMRQRTHFDRYQLNKFKDMFDMHYSSAIKRYHLSTWVENPLNDTYSGRSSIKYSFIYLYELHNGQIIVFYSFMNKLGQFKEGVDKLTPDNKKGYIKRKITVKARKTLNEIKDFLEEEIFTSKIKNNTIWANEGTGVVLNSKELKKRL